MYKIYQTLLLPSILAVSLTSAKAEVPPELESIQFSGPKITPCPACLCAAATGEVFVGVDNSLRNFSGANDKYLGLFLGKLRTESVTLECGIVRYVNARTFHLLHAGGGELVSNENSHW